MVQRNLIHLIMIQLALVQDFLNEISFLMKFVSHNFMKKETYILMHAFINKFNLKMVTSVASMKCFMYVHTIMFFLNFNGSYLCQLSVVNRGGAEVQISLRFC